MIAAIRSEYSKFFSTRMWWILTAAMVGYFLLVTFGMGWFFAYMGVGPTGGMGADVGGFSEQVTPMIYGLGVSMGYVFPVIVGAIAVTAEYRHNTIVPTFLGEPRRWVVMTAKAIAAIPMGVVIGITGTLACIVGGAIGMQIGGADTMLQAAQTWQNAGLSVLAFTMWALVGVGLGMLITNQVGVIITVLAFTQLVEPLARIALGTFDQTEWTVKFLPGAASDSVAGGTSIYSMMQASVGAGDTLNVWQGALVLACYGLIFGVLGYFLRIRRDVA